MDSEDLEEPLLLVEEEEQQEEEEEEVSVSYFAPLTLLFVSFLFATLNVSLRSLYTMANAATPAEVNAVRGWFTVLFFLLPLLVRRRNTHATTSPATASTTTNASSSNTSPKPLHLCALELAGWNFGGQVLVNVGLLTTPSARASFLGQTVVVLVPLLSALGGERLSLKNGVGCVCSIVGVLLLSASTSSAGSDATASSLELLPGDLWILASAFCFSCYLIRITHLASYYDEIYLQGSKNTIMAGFYSIWLGVSRHSSFLWTHSILAWTILAYTAFGPGILADILQQQAQKLVKATQSNLILCTSSVFTALLARLLLGEQTTVEEKWGGFFLITGAIIAGSS
jgi:drug/metabolite transporter (DMT)-like permease